MPQRYNCLPRTMMVKASIWCRGINKRLFENRSVIFGPWNFDFLVQTLAFKYTVTALSTGCLILQNCLNLFLCWILYQDWYSNVFKTKTQCEIPVRVILLVQEDVTRLSSRRNVMVIVAKNEISDPRSNLDLAVCISLIHLFFLKTWVNSWVD